MLVEIPSLRGYYASSDGSIHSTWAYGPLSTPRKPPRMLTGKLNKVTSYLEVTLAGKTHAVHKLVATVFRGSCPDGKQCRHLDGNPLNNCIDNLAWGTPAENQADRRIHGTDNSGARNGRYKHGRYMRCT